MVATSCVVSSMENPMGHHMISIIEDPSGGY